MIVINYGIHEVEENGGHYVYISLKKKDVDHTALKVLNYDRPYSIVPLTILYDDEEILLKYNVSGLEKLYDLNLRLDQKIFIDALMKLSNLLCNCHYWFLDDKKFLYRHHIYYDYNAGHILLLYLPLSVGTPISGFKEFLANLINLVEVNDGDKLKIGILGLMLSESFSPVSLQRYLSGILQKKTAEIVDNTPADSTAAKVSVANLLAVNNSDKPKPGGFWNWLFRPKSSYIHEEETTYVGENSITYHQLQLQRNETEYRLPKTINLKFYDNILLLGKSSVKGDSGPLKYSFAGHINQINDIHLKLEKVDERVYLSDLNSDLGTYHNGQKLDKNERVELKHGDAIAISPAIEYIFQKIKEGP